MVAASAGYVVASLRFLNHHFAFIAFFEEQVVLQNFDSVLVTRAFVLFEEAFQAKLLGTNYASQWYLISKHEAYAILPWTKSLVGVFTNLSENQYFVIFFSLLLRHFLVDFRIFSNSLLASSTRALY